MSRSDLEYQIAKRQEWIKSLQDSLPYADSSQARNADEKLIRGYRMEIGALKDKLEKLGGGNVSDNIQVP